MKYLAILGQNPDLSLAELSAVYPDIKISSLSKEAVILETAEKIDINGLGGLPKLAELLEDGIPLKNAGKIIADELLKLGKDQKIFFGLSFYNNENRGLYNGLGREIKSALKNAGAKARWAVSRELALSSVYIKTNKLLTRGFDFDVVFLPPSVIPATCPAKLGERSGKAGIQRSPIKSGMTVVIAKTIAVQDFSDYEFRDMRRPRRDLVSGMTPPKLAKILINLALPPLYKRGAGLPFVAPKERRMGGDFLDPFCGSGTFLMEAALLGFQKIYGSDASDKAVADTKENMEWLANNYKNKISPSLILPLGKGEESGGFEIKKCRAEEALKCWSKKFDYIVTEPYLGPPVRGELAKHKAIDLQQKLSANYEKYLSGLSAILNPGGRLILIAPFFLTEKGNFFLPLKLKENGLKAVHPSILYSRSDQKVGREIFVLKKL